MLLRKETGGCSLTWERATYTWDADGDVAEVPPELGAMLLAIKGGGYEIVDSPSARQLKALKAKADAAEAEAERLKAEAEAAAAAALASKSADTAAGDGKDAPKDGGASA